ncbi:hypothetical protein PO909_016163, partial [Leuciscus waleckii]
MFDASFYRSSTALPSDLASVAGGLGLVLLVLTLCCGTFIICRKRKRKSRTALFQQNMQHNTETDHMSEEIPNTDFNVVTSSSNQAPAFSSNQMPASHLNYNTETDHMSGEIPNTDFNVVTFSSNQTPAFSSNQTPAFSSNQTPAFSSNQTPAFSSNQTPAFSSNQTPTPHLNYLTNVSTLYTSGTNQQPDSNPSHTHSTNQVTDTAGDYYANIKSPKATQDSGTELIYVTATHPQNISTNEGQTIYSVI